MTGMFLSVLWLIIFDNRPVPEFTGITTSVKTRSMQLFSSSRTVQASRTSGTAVTDKKKFPNLQQHDLRIKKKDDSNTFIAAVLQEGGNNMAS